MPQLALLTLLGGPHSMYVDFWKSGRLLPLSGLENQTIYPEACRCNCDSPALSTQVYRGVSIRLKRILISRHLVRFSVGILDGSANSHCGPRASQPQNASEKFQYSSTGYKRCVQFLLCKDTKLNVAETDDTRGRLVLM